jgi:hypothetical protein
MRSARSSALLALGLAICLVSCRPSVPEGPPKPRLIFLGIDGATWKVIGPLLERGELPAFRRLVEEGASMPRFETLSTTFSPVVWTSIATGAAPEDHGILSFTSQLPNGQLIPVTSNARRRRAIWELASRRGVSVGVIGWWASWPAEEVDGYVVSDHANPAFSELLFEDRNYWTADRATLARLKRDFLPLDLGPILARHWIPRDRFPWDDLQRRGRFTDAQMEVARAAPWNHRDVYSWLKTFYRVDEPLFRSALDLARERPTDLQMLYLRGPDPVQHYGWDLVEPERFAVRPPHLERDRGLIEGVYRYLDTFVAEILAAKHPDAWLLVASDHGAEPAAQAMDPKGAPRPGEHGPDAKGVLFLLGPGVKRGYQLQRGNPYDLLPTLAWLLRLPIAEDLPGKPLTEAFDESFVRSLPVAKVPTYGPRQTGPLLASAADREMIESLRQLGYVQ